MTLALDDFPRLPPEYVRRERLNDSLSAMKNDQLIVIEGPPGIGKTSLVADWASQDLGSFECTWLTLDSSVTSAQLLWNAIHEEFCPGLLSPPVGYAGLAAWINKQDKPLRIVIDDFYWAPLQVVLEVLKFAHMLTNGQVIVLTRRDASGILKPQAQRMSSGWITADDLYLDLNEVRLLKSELYPGSAEFTKAEFEQLQTLSEGHPLLTRLALKEEGLASAEEIAEQSGGWIVGQLESRNFTNTLHVSLLPLFNLELLESLFGRAQARSLIADLERTGIGHAAPAGFMKLCGPAGAAVHHQALLILSQAEQDETLRIATDYFKDLKGYAAQTVHLLCTTGRYEELWPYFASNFEDVFHPEIVKEINSLPRRVREKYPMVATLALLIQASRERHPSINLLAEVDSILALLETRVYEADIEVRLYDQVARLALAWSARRFEEAEEPTEEILKLLSELAVQEGAEVREAAYWGLLYASVMMALCGRFDLAERYLYSMESDQDPARSARRTLQHAFINAMRGEVLTSQQILADNIFHVENSAHWSLVFAITQAAIWLEDGNAFAAQKILKEAEALLNKATNWPYALIVLARTHLFTSPEAGTEDLRRLTRMHGDRYIAAGLQDLLHSAVIDLSVAAGDLRGARDQLGSATSGSPAVVLSAARLGLITGDHTAQRQLEHLAQNDALGSRLRTQTLNLLAVYRHRNGKEQGARDALARSLSLAPSCGINVVLALVPQADLSQIAAKANITLPPYIYTIPSLDTKLEPVSLSKRENLLLHYFVTHADFKTIAAKEFVSVNTIKSQAMSIYQKLGVNSRFDAIDGAKQRGLLDMKLVARLEKGLGTS